MSTMTMDAPASTGGKSGSGKGCLFGGIAGGCLVIVLGCGGIIGFGVFAAFGMLKTSEPYVESLRRAQQNPEVQMALGEPIEADFIVQGNINLNNADGDADLRYNVSGPKGSAEVHVVGNKSDGQWQYERMDATIGESGTLIDLKTD